VNDSQPWAEAVAIKDGKFLVVGSNADIEPVTGDATEVVNLGGHMAMPGLIDVHAHPLSVAENWANVKIENPGNADAILEQLRKYVEANPDVAMIRGEAWNLGVFPGDSPRKELLDDIVADRPVYLVSQTGHSAWVNSKALEMAGITKETPVTTRSFSTPTRILENRPALFGSLPWGSSKGFSHRRPLSNLLPLCRRSWATSMRTVLLHSNRRKAPAAGWRARPTLNRRID